MRLIDADEVKETIRHRTKLVEWQKGIIWALIDMHKTVDAVPVIRFKDCKYAEREDDGDILCTFWDFCECNHHVLENGYCDRAERRNDERME